MTLVELNPKPQLDGRRGSVESRCALDDESAPAPAPRRPAAPELDSVSRLRAWASGPITSLVARGAGITLLMLGLGGIGAYAMARGLHPLVALAEPATAQPSSQPRSMKAEMGGLATPPADPSHGPAPAASTQPSPAAEPGAPSALTADGRVILNLASFAELRKLPGVGPKRAEAILALRLKLGKFRRLTDLLRIRGIGPRRLKQLEGRMVVDAPAGAMAPSKPAPSAAAPGT